MSRVHIVDDDPGVRKALRAQLVSARFEVECYADGEAFLQAYAPAPPECLVLDLRMPGMSGMELRAELERRGVAIPTIFLTAYGDISTGVRAMKAGAVDFLTKPVEPSKLIATVEAALEQSQHEQRDRDAEQAARERLASLTEREREVLELAIAGLQSKEIARKLGISHRTVELHRLHVLRKTGAATLLELVHLKTTLTK